VSALPAPDGKTPLGVCVWFVPGRAEVLTWGGDYDMVRRCPSVDHGGQRFAGAPVEAVSARCENLGEAQRAVAAWLAELPGDPGLTAAAPAAD
jgi:hypothetical protein